MRTNIEIDDKLMRSAMRAGAGKTKRAAVQTALQTFVNLRKQELALRSMAGTVKWEGDLLQSRENRFKGVE